MPTDDLNDPPPAPIPALQYHIASDESWRGLVRLMLLLGLILGSFDILMAPLSVWYTVQDRSSGQGIYAYEAYMTYVAAAVQFVLGIAIIDAAVRGRSFSAGTDRAIVRVLSFSLAATAFFTAWTAIAIGLRFNEYWSYGAAYASYTIGYHANWFLFAMIPSIAGIYVFTRPEVKQLYVEDSNV